MALDEGFVADKDLIQNDYIGDCVHHSHWEEKDDESEEGNVVLGTNTSVEPAAVMIETVSTAIANTAVLWGIHHRSLTHVTFKVIVSTVKFFAKRSVCNHVQVLTHVPQFLFVASQLGQLDHSAYILQQVKRLPRISKYRLLSSWLPVLNTLIATQYLS